MFKSFRLLDSVVIHNRCTALKIRFSNWVNLGQLSADPANTYLYFPFSLLLFNRFLFALLQSCPFSWFSLQTVLLWNNLRVQLSDGCVNLAFSVTRYLLFLVLLKLFTSGGRVSWQGTELSCFSKWYIRLNLIPMKTVVRGSRLSFRLFKGNHCCKILI